MALVFINRDLHMAYLIMAFVGLVYAFIYVLFWSEITIMRNTLLSCVII